MNCRDDKYIAFIGKLSFRWEYRILMVIKTAIKKAFRLFQAERFCRIFYMGSFVRSFL
jgi:hypothetical protein